MNINKHKRYTICTYVWNLSYNSNKKIHLHCSIINNIIQKKIIKLSLLFYNYTHWLIILCLLILRSTTQSHPYLNAKCQELIHQYNRSTPDYSYSSWNKLHHSYLSHCQQHYYTSYYQICHLHHSQFSLHYFVVYRFH